MRYGIAQHAVIWLTALIIALVVATSARADFSSYCGHGYISNGSVKDVFVREFNEGLKHYHIYKTYVKITYDGTTFWGLSHQHKRVC